MSRRLIRCLLVTAAAAALNCAVRQTGGAEPQSIPGAPFSATGNVAAVGKDWLLVNTTAGSEVRLKFPPDPDASGESTVEINRKYRFRTTAPEIAVRGALDVSYLAEGRSVVVEGELSRLGRLQDAIALVEVIDARSRPPGIALADAGRTSTAATEQATIVATIQKIKGKRLFLSVPAGPGAPKGTVIGTLAADAEVRVSSRRWTTARRGDEIHAEGLQFDGEDVLVQRCTITLAGSAGGGPSRESPRSSRDLEAAKRYAGLSSAPGQPRMLRSRNFLLHTDLSERNAAQLLEKLETMHGLIVSYFGRRQTGLIECYVVRDISQWPADTFPPAAVAKIQEPAGVTISAPTVVGKRPGLRTIAYACADDGVAQHEAVHAFCRQTFGDVGPSWYAEGMAELGQYFKHGQRAVDVRPAVIDYLTSNEPKALLDIVNPREPPGRWQDYAWRWALCHLLESNPNYAGPFKQLGIGLMENTGASFEATYGEVAKEIAFEYEFFLRHLGNGYRADLAAWDWKARFRPLAAGNRRNVKVRADRGWQPSSIEVVVGQQYAVTVAGEWCTLEGGAEVTADGDATGRGRLLGAVLCSDGTSYRLGAAFELGAATEFTAVESGPLYFRCRDEFTELADNRGSVSVTVSLAERGP